ncbi:Tripeptidyl-peptidase sed3 [Penicillium diatomitis]|uniref:tripeptidyl-peptidase II n=1 Tax=Penicillium diatomitis TaxID=2819901 RepID=A0A9X0BN96_9EURO|nr:Tripeptidyl-peptidase sed3 [Penicillium diatomitis]KAJ5475480.1 Tripeptidyl-peptidase sed3 [Penicillium diatomitis]
MKSPGTAALEQTVLEVSSPHHPRYGKHMKRDEVADLLQPEPNVLDIILSWLYSNKVSENSIDVHGNWVSFEATVSQAEAMFHTQFSYHHNSASQRTLIRTLEYSVPCKIRPHIHSVQPTTKFGKMEAPQNTDLSKRAGLPLDQPIGATAEDLVAECGIVMRPDCIRDLYGLYSTTASPDPANRLGVSGFLDQYARHADLTHFIHRFSSTASNLDFNVVSVNGGMNPQKSSASSTEASLDVQYAAALAHNAPVTFYTTAGRARSKSPAGQLVVDDSQNEPFLDQLHYLINLPDDELPAVLTTSYGEIEQSVPAAYARSVCNLFAQLGARGVSVIFSSGDSGVGESCLSNDGKNRTRFQTIFPASCPFVTAVGGVEGMHPEVAIDFSSGGFSDIFGRPEYQDQAVDNYLDHLGSQWAGYYNPRGRATPDVAAQAKNFIIRDHDTWLKISGTRFVPILRF